MKKVLLFAILSTSIIFTNCKKKKDDPAPAAATNPFGTTSAVSSNGKTTALTVTSYSASGFYIIEGADAGKAFIIDASFPKGQPTASSTEDLSKSSFSLDYSTSTSDFTATSGTANIIVGDTTITVTFTDVSFTDGTSTVKYSGQLIVSTKKTTGGTTGGVTTSGGSGTFTLGTGTASNLSVTSATSSSTGAYSITGIISGTSNSVLIVFPAGKPTSSSTENLTTSGKIYVGYNTSATQYLSSAGSAVITVNSSSGEVNVTFTNAILTDGSGNSGSIKASANITASK